MWGASQEVVLMVTGFLIPVVVPVAVVGWVLWREEARGG